MSPTLKSIERGWRKGAKPQIETKKATGKIKDADHARNFLDCVKSRKAPTCDVEFGHRCTFRRPRFSSSAGFHQPVI